MASLNTKTKHRLVVWSFYNFIFNFLSKCINMMVWMFQKLRQPFYFSEIQKFLLKSSQFFFFTLGFLAVKLVYTKKVFYTKALGTSSWNHKFHWVSSGRGSFTEFSQYVLWILRVTTPTRSFLQAIQRWRKQEKVERSIIWSFYYPLQEHFFSL